jgi:hypothetical protein
MYNTCSTDRHFKCWGACHHRLLLTHKPLVLLCPPLWMIVPRVTRTYACLWCRCLSSALDPRSRAGVEQHSCYNSTLGIPGTSICWLVLCCTSLLGDWSQALLLHSDRPHWIVSLELIQEIYQVAALHLPRRPSGMKCLLWLDWQWYRAPKALMAAPYANSSLLLLDHETSLSSSPAVWVCLLTQLGRSSMVVLPMMLGEWCRSLHSTLWTLLL